MHPSIEEVLSPDYLPDDLTAIDLDVLRSARRECQRLEAGQSYFRRLVQGHLDIVRAERDRRAAELPPSADVIESVSSALSGVSVRAEGLPRPQSHLDPAMGDELVAELDGLIPMESFSRLAAVDSLELSELELSLSEIERRVSDTRRLLHRRIDALQHELTRRYRIGEADIETLWEDR